MLTEMKKITQIELKCPYCEKKFTYNIFSFKARKECPNCEYDLLVRFRPLYSCLLTLPGFFLALGLDSFFQIFRYGKVIELSFLVIISLVFLSLAKMIINRWLHAEKMYIVDMEDPTILERKKRNRR